MSRKNRPPIKKTPYERPERYARKKNRRDKHKRATREPWFTMDQVPYGIIILVYFFVVTFTPNWMALDTNTTKFLTLSLLNLLSFGYLLSRPDIRRQPGVLMRFFDTRVGLAYGGFMLLLLLSFTQAINVHESIIHYSKMFSTFMAVFILSVILMRDMRYVKLIVVTCTLLLIFDSVSVFYYIGEFIEGNVRSISDIKSVYSNKNILASAMFVKIPFALYLWMFGQKKWMKGLGLLAVFLGILATLFMRTRGFYVGLIVITLVFTVYSVFNYYRERRLGHFRLLAGFLGALVLAFLLFNTIRNNLFPQNRRESAAIGAQLATIQDDAQESNRINAWTWSMDIIKQNPILGVGAGNWKINILEYENQVNTGYIYLYKAHNDFIENTAETGIIGGLLYLFIYVFLFYTLLRAYLNRQQHTQRYRHLFLAGIGMFFYSFDAFFNFPHDRPEIQMIFALFLSIGVVTTLKKPAEEGEETDVHTAGELETGQAQQPSRKLFARLLSGLLILLMLGASYILYTNFQSSKLQRIVYQDIMRNKLDHDADLFIEGFPWIPNLSVWGESINALKARYLLNENRYEETIELLRDDHINPWDGRREHFMATAFQSLDMPDSALYFGEQVFQVKPFYFRNIHMLSNILEQKGRAEEAYPYLDKFLSRHMSDQQAVLYASSYFGRQRDTERAWEVIDEAYALMPNDSLIERQHQVIHHQLFIAPHQHIYAEAVRRYNNGQFNRALPLLDEYIALTPYDESVHRMRAFALYHLGQHQDCMEAINYIFERGSHDPALINLRGVCYQALGDQDAACADFREAMEAGNANGEQNFRNFCAGRE